MTYCAPCWADLLQSRSNRTGADLNAYYKRTYGLSLGQYGSLMMRQGGRCAICQERAEKPLVVDHDHDTGDVRGLLCGTCNSGLGMFKDNAATVSAAVTYLLREPPPLIGWWPGDKGKILQMASGLGTA